MDEEDASIEVPALFPKIEEIEAILDDIKTIAVVGLSEDRSKPSHMVGAYLKAKGFRVIPINPRIKEFHGEKAYPDLGSIPKDLRPIDVVDIFRKPEYVMDIVKEAIMIGAKNIWMQEGVVANEAAKLAVDSGLGVVMDKCIKKELMAYDLRKD